MKNQDMPLSKSKDKFLACVPLVRGIVRREREPHSYRVPQGEATVEAAFPHFVTRKPFKGSGELSELVVVARFAELDMALAVTKLLNGTDHDNVYHAYTQY